MDNELVGLWDELERFAESRGGQLQRYKDRAVYAIHDGTIWLTVSKTRDYQAVIWIDRGETREKMQYATDSTAALEFIVDAAMRHINADRNWVPRFLFDPGVLRDPAMISDRKTGDAMATPGSTPWDEQVAFVLEFLDGEGADVVEMDVSGMGISLAQEIHKRRADITVVHQQTQKGPTIRDAGAMTTVVNVVNS